MRHDGAAGAGRHAYVTLVTNADYALGARALLRSLRLAGTQADLVVMHTGGVDTAALGPLQGFGARLVAVDLLPTSDAFNERHGRARLHGAAPFTKGGKPPFHTPLDNFAKLRLWQMTEYEKVVFLDADTLVLRNCDRLFAYPEFSAAPNVYEGLSDFHRMNSGVFVARPDAATFDAMMQALDRPDAFWPRTDQTFLQAFFPDWHGLPVFCNMLQYVWFNMPALWNWQQVRIVHYQYEKPWQDHDKADRLRPLIDLWRAYAGDGPVPDLDDLPGPQPSDPNTSDPQPSGAP
ncbi:glycosyltransferase [Halodurantibacterium flavum]|uniref:Glycosyltransferase n=1 Tax=Halodurantibacterium flavum TaxID=1382802 RepID=A0ABW4S7I1_9RHOB